jgi:serine protease Do
MISVISAEGWQGSANLVVGEFEQDIAIIKVEGGSGFSGVEIAPEIFLGQDVFAIGHPLGRNHTVTRGVISYPRRTVNQRPYVQTDTSINPGNSGGGLFDELGRLVGLPTFKEVWADRNKTIPVVNIGFAVPGDVVQDFYQRALQRNLALGCSGDPRSARKAVVIE